ncbi:hypothetical protein A2397_01630 [Candidatus Amesbacteria bacterium RIFOXYB1_FULL_44_23]|uniref:Uncharacterized protein n=1 Tax=Candidatus Amesbacteria bacterium RIFOXYB1_FULL_44_23 TaxID=1797263 RepID=A0A1F4ZSP0_9BACT|nr:MAG: hypothetical protein A2397_01630 [Candidatus Amesbacteria bacterium RIFOXYB1_FULL_44_23]
METLDLSDFFTSKAESSDFCSRLATVSQSVYETDFDLQKALLEQFGILKKDKFMALLRDNEISIESNSDLQEFMNKICQKASALPTVTISLAFEPDETILKEFSSWFVLNTNHQVLIDIQIDPSLIAGASITSNGKFHDFSAKSKFNQMLSDFLNSQSGPTLPASPA